jgi:hypothetical protein
MSRSPPPPSPSNQPGATTGERRLSTSSTPRARPLPSTPMSHPSLRLLLPGKNCRSGCSSALLNLKGVPRLLVVSPALHRPSFAEVVWGKGKLPVRLQGSDPHRSKGKEPLDPTMTASSSAGRHGGLHCSCLEASDVADHGRGFMADAHRASAGHQPPSSPPRHAQDADRW